MKKLTDAILDDLIKEAGLKVQSGVRAGLDASYGKVKPIPANFPYLIPIIK